jgi:hypothetical protein
MFREELMLFASYICHLSEGTNLKELEEALPSVKQISETFEADPEDELVAFLVLRILQCTTFKIEKELVIKMLSTVLFSPKRFVCNKWHLPARTKENLDAALKSLVFQISLNKALSYAIECLAAHSSEELLEKKWLRIRFITVFRFFASEKLADNALTEVTQSSSFNDLVMLCLQSPEEGERASMIAVLHYSAKQLM